MVEDFHPQWCLYRPEDIPPVDPRLLILDPEVIRSRGCPAGAVNIPTARQVSEARSTR